MFCYTMSLISFHTQCVLWIMWLRHRFLCMHTLVLFILTDAANISKAKNWIKLTVKSAIDFLLALI